ncbi:MAG TPA: radical SAM protein [Firmicutes bacterium]|nr:radical SAM protein [Bacillota bacterium]
MKSIRVSLGTAILLGLVRGRNDVDPTTAYLLTEGGCARACAFCAQARAAVSGCTGNEGDENDIRGKDMLSRVVWPSFPLDEVAGAIARNVLGVRANPGAGPGSSGLSRKETNDRCAAGDAHGVEPGIRRICFQVTSRPGVLDDVKGAILALREAFRREAGAIGGQGCCATGRTPAVPISVSYHPGNLNEIEELFALGVERIGIALDAANERIFHDIKGGSFAQTLDLLERAARNFPGKVSTHIIVGLGETEEEALRLIQRLHDSGITVGLFAFTPVKGTPLESRRPPDIGSYRRIQAGRYLIVNSISRVESFAFSDEGAGSRVTGFGIIPSELVRLLASGDAFRTSGCVECNRPYYNERPGGTIYNYPRPLTMDEVRQAVEKMGLPDLRKEVGVPSLARGGRILVPKWG